VKPRPRLTSAIDPQDNRASSLQVVDRSVAILEALASDTPELGVTELARATGMSKGTVHRILASLEHHRLVEQDSESKRYRLGLRLFEFGSRATAQIDYVRLVEPYLQQLASQTGETTHLAILDDGTILYVAKVDGWHSLRMPSQIGKRLPTHCTALGKVMLAGLPDVNLRQIIKGHGLVQLTPNTLTSLERLKSELEAIRRHGYSVDNEELELGLRCVAAPVVDSNGDVVAAVSISGPTTRITTSNVAKLAPLVVACCDAISRNFAGIIRAAHPMVAARRPL
jgi:IclR family transcriptional regulator, KDG regulon repressor